MSSLKDKSSVGLSPPSGYRPGRGNLGKATYSTSLDQDGGLLMVMNTQLVRMVIMINMLNSVEVGQGKRGRRQLGRGGHRKVSSPPLTSPPFPLGQDMRE